MRTGKGSILFKYKNDIYCRGKLEYVIRKIFEDLPNGNFAPMRL